MKRKMLLPLLFLFLVFIHLFAPALEAGENLGSEGNLSAFHNRDLSTEECREILRFAFLFLNNGSPGFIFPESLKNDDLQRFVILSIPDGSGKVPDWKGGYYRPPGSTPAATRTEGLYAACGLALASGNRGRAEKCLDAIGKGVAFQLNTQIGPENAWWFPDPSRSLGGFRKSLTESEIRIDYVQHNISAMVGLLNLMKDREEKVHEE